jgi:hypothetical protein
VSAFDTWALSVVSDGISTDVRIPTGTVLPPLLRIGVCIEIVAAISGQTLTPTMLKLDEEQAAGSRCWLWCQRRRRRAGRRDGDDDRHELALDPTRRRCNAREARDAADAAASSYRRFALARR